MKDNKDCDEWHANPTINPHTRRKITVNGAVYKKLAKECDDIGAAPAAPQRAKAGVNAKDCEVWRKDPTHNPVNGRLLRLDAKAGIFAQLVKLCGKELPTAEATKVPVRVPVRVPVPGAPEPKTYDRKRLIAALKHAIGPILHKGDTLGSRVQFARIIRDYLMGLQPCLLEDPVSHKLILQTKDMNATVQFDKRIGTESAYGVAYMNMGKGFAKLLQFSCKLMSSSVRGHGQEIVLLKKMSEIAESGRCPNMPITYLSLKCTKKCEIDACPVNTKTGGYYVVVNELASSDIQTWFKTSHTNDMYVSVIMQLLLAIHCFHRMGYSHNDCHLGNFLIHDIKPGGYWRYQVGGVDVYVPNMGAQLVMWDPGRATELKSKNYGVDFNRALTLMFYMEDIYNGKGLKHMDNYMLKQLDTIYSILGHSKKQKLYNGFESAFAHMISLLTPDPVTKIRVIDFPQIVVGAAPPDFLLNVKPYTL